MKRLVAVFDTPEALAASADKLKAAGIPAEDALSPFPVHGLEDALSLKAGPVRRVMAIAGFSTAALAWFIQWFSLSVAYPFLSGGRPHNSWQIFPLVMFEAGVLAAGIAGFIAFLYTCGLPALNHPAFDAQGVERASCDRFFLFVNPAGAGAEERVRRLLTEEGALSIEEVAA
jgi:hypothetical protein